MLPSFSFSATNVWNLATKSYTRLGNQIWEPQFNKDVLKKEIWHCVSKNSFFSWIIYSFSFLGYNLTYKVTNWYLFTQFLTFKKQWLLETYCYVCTYPVSVSFSLSSDFVHERHSFVFSNPLVKHESSSLSPKIKPYVVASTMPCNEI